MVQFLDVAPIPTFSPAEWDDHIFIPYWILLPLLGLLVVVCMFLVFWFRKRLKKEVKKGEFE